MNRSNWRVNPVFAMQTVLPLLCAILYAAGVANCRVNGLKGRVGNLNERFSSGPDLFASRMVRQQGAPITSVRFCNADMFQQRFRETTSEMIP